MLETSWRNELAPEFENAYFRSLNEHLTCEYREHILYPKPEAIFRAFELTPFDQVKVVILGQDPYHGPGQANGLSFSVPHGVKMPPSLVNIFKEIKNDLGTHLPDDGNLENWAKQGVLLLNSILTVTAGKAGAHRKLGWESFTDAAIKALNSKRQGLVFLLWGNYAINKSELIDPSKHLVLKAPHPSPLSAYHGWFGCKHFSQTNEWLINQGQSAIQW
ncbi:MAG: uracil-DNA glycosylase [Bacteroidia bacterium]